MPSYSAITIIYNPNSTGPSKRLAEELFVKLTKVMPSQKVTIVATKHAGHAEVLAYDAGKSLGQALVVSASGDGGYHEVINGLMKATAEGFQPIASLLPAGNANDHYSAVHTADLVAAIQSHTFQYVDLLKLSTVAHGNTFERYAHSYIGFGLTPQVGQELNKTSLNRLRETMIVSRSLLHIKPIRLLVDGKERTYDSLICSNIPKMSKILSLAKHAEIDDGLFEITAFRRRSKLRLIYSLLQAATFGLYGDRQATEYRFATTSPLLVQLDGEVRTIDAASEVVITSEKRSLCCIL